MTLKEYFATQPRGVQMNLCRDIGITKTWLSLLVNKKRRPSKHLALVISMYTDNVVSIDELLN